MKRYIVRPQNWPSESPEGNFVLHSDHEAALAEAVSKAWREAADMADAWPFESGGSLADEMRARSKP